MQVFVVGPLRQDTRQMIKRLAFFYSITTRDTIIVEPGPDLDIIFSMEVFGPLLGLACLSLLPVVYKKMKKRKNG